MPPAADRAVQPRRWRGPTGRELRRLVGDLRWLGHGEGRPGMGLLALV